MIDECIQAFEDNELDFDYDVKSAYLNSLMNVRKPILFEKLKLNFSALQGKELLTGIRHHEHYINSEWIEEKQGNKSHLVIVTTIGFIEQKEVNAFEKVKGFG